ncbi:uncharacterized protein LOC103795641 [Callithrix jacchus]
MVLGGPWRIRAAARGRIGAQQEPHPAVRPGEPECGPPNPLTRVPLSHPMLPCKFLEAVRSKNGGILKAFDLSDKHTERGTGSKAKPGCRPITLPLEVSEDVLSSPFWLGQCRQAWGSQSKEGKALLYWVPGLRSSPGSQQVVACPGGRAHQFQHQNQFQGPTQFPAQPSSQSSFRGRTGRSAPSRAGAGTRGKAGPTRSWSILLTRPGKPSRKREPRVSMACPAPGGSETGRHPLRAPWSGRGAGHGSRRCRCSAWRTHAPPASHGAGPTFGHRERGAQGERGTLGAAELGARRLGRARRGGLTLTGRRTRYKRRGAPSPRPLRARRLSRTGARLSLVGIRLVVLVPGHLQGIIFPWPLL